MFYEIFAQLCKQNGVKETTLARELGMGPSAPGRWKKGSTPDLANAKKIADYFGVSVDYLMGQKEKSTPTVGDGLDNELFAFYGEVKPYLDEDDIEDLKIFMAAKAERKRRKMEDDKD